MLCEVLGVSKVLSQHPCLDSSELNRYLRTYDSSYLLELFSGLYEIITYRVPMTVHSIEIMLNKKLLLLFLVSVISVIAVIST